MILSISRRTDIPAFYSDWFYNRIEEGFLYVRNPINKKLVYKIDLNPEKIDCLVFWTKNPAPFLSRMNNLDKYKYYFQFTLNPYDRTIEKNVPYKKDIIDTFINLSNRIGKEKVIWRYDPIFYTNIIDKDYHLIYFDELARRITPYTDKCVISFLDMYKKCEQNLKDTSIRCLSKFEIFDLIKNIKPIADKYDLIIETCAEHIDLSEFQVGHNRCIDNCLIEKLVGCSLVAKKDKNQRIECGCIESIDVGAYNTCKHNCLYCYANFNTKMVNNNVGAHDPSSPLLIGEIKESDVIVERQINSFKTQVLF